MNSTWFNLRVLLWHIQIDNGRLFRPAIRFNPWWWRLELLWRPVWLHSFEPRQGWSTRGQRNAYVGQEWTP